MKTIVKNGITYEGEKVVEDGDFIRCECGGEEMIFFGHDCIVCKDCGSKIKVSIPNPSIVIDD